MKEVVLKTMIAASFGLSNFAAADQNSFPIYSIPLIKFIPLKPEPAPKREIPTEGVKSESASIDGATWTHSPQEIHDQVGQLLSPTPEVPAKKDASTAVKEGT